jgi:hypothetical protein
VTEENDVHKQLELVREPGAESFAMPAPLEKKRRYHPVWDFFTQLFYVGCLLFFIYWFGWPWFMDMMTKKVSDAGCVDVCVLTETVALTSFRKTLRPT